MKTEIDTPAAPVAAGKPADAPLPAVTAATIEKPAAKDRSLLSPLMQSMVMAHAWSSDILENKALLRAEDVAADMRDHAAAVHAGDMRSIEAAMIGQAETLGAMFTSLQRRARNTSDIERFRALLTLALKAQAQSRATYETIAEIRNPRQVLIARQANIAQQQMVSNGGARERSHQPARTEANTNAPIELLEEPHGYSLDPGAARAPVADDPRAATVGEVDRTADTRGQGRRVKKRVQGRLAPQDA